MGAEDVGVEVLVVAIVDSEAVDAEVVGVELELKNRRGTTEA